MGFPGGSECKASACNAGDLGSIPGSGRSPGEGNDNPLQFSCLDNPTPGHIVREHYNLKRYVPLCSLQPCGGSDSKESACQARDLGLIPGSGRCPEEGNG